MLGLLVFGAMGLWALLTCLMLAYLLRRIWRGRREKPGPDWRSKPAIYGLFVLAWLVGFFWYGGGQNFYYDAKVNRLCAIDGGIKVYETVKLPPEKFNEWGHINFRRYTQGENSLGPEYIFKREEKHYRKSNPELIRYHYEVIRRSDGKNLGETTLYQRGGSDLLRLLLLSSSYECPSTNDSGDGTLLNRIFIKSTM
jgi:hypothetical protein